MSSVSKFAQKLLRRAPSSARHVLDNSVNYEEEKLKWYTPEKFYSVRIWEVFDKRYQVVGKLGYGAYSTVWLCRDLNKHNYVCVKVSEANSRQAERDREAYKHIKSITTSHAGSKCVRMLSDSFNITTATGTHICMLPQGILKLTLKHVLLALEFLHSECNLTHTDIQAKNILMGIDDENVLTEFEEAEVLDPSPCKIPVNGDRVIYTSRPLRVRGSAGRPVLCDFGEARIGDGKFTNDIQPFLYRAPEVILRKSWDKKVDIWNLGVLVWDLSRGKHLFDARNANTNIVHLAEMVALLGSPPKSFLEGSPIVGDYFDKSGRWIGDVEIPSNSLEGFEENLKGEEKVLFLQFIRKMLQRVPEERMSAFNLLDDPWLNS